MPMTPDQLRAWRNNHSMTQQELADLLGVTKTCVYRWEAGLRKIPPFLHLALECVERKGGARGIRVTSKTKGGDL
jgi:DNA-binding XRE family transcriptional regulator